MRIKIGGKIYVVDRVEYYGYLPMICAKGIGFYVAEDSDMADSAVQEYWYDMANDDPEELVALLGADQVIRFAFSTGDDIDDWIESQEAAQFFGSYDGTSQDVDVCGRLLEEELGFVPTVAYRHN
jgi:hypothetical protein